MARKGSTKQGKSQVMCPFGKQPYFTKVEAQKNSPSGHAKRCGRCRNWHTD